MNPRPAVPDLLKRLVATPLNAYFCFGTAKVQLHTNDPEVIAAASDLDAACDRTTGKSFAFWKVVRESEPSPNLGCTVIETEELRILLRGEGTVITVDRLRGEAIGFLAPDATAEDLRTVIFPFMAAMECPWESH